MLYYTGLSAVESSLKNAIATFWHWATLYLLQIHHHLEIQHTDVRFIIIQYTDSDKLTEEEKKEFKHWLIEEDRIEKLGVLGDFAVKYIIEHPDLVLEFKDSLWYKPGETILKEFYKSCGKEPPAWLEFVAEQSAVQESNEEKHFELVGFLRHTIQRNYI